LQGIFREVSHQHEFQGRLLTSSTCPFSLGKRLLCTRMGSHKCASIKPQKREQMGEQNQK
jgi:hypothetical protein